MEPRLFFLITNGGTVPHDLRGWTVFTTDEDFVYYPYCDDFGPFNLATIYRFCAKLKNLLESTSSPNGPVLYYTTGDHRQAANCAVLIAAFLVMHMGRTVEEACQPLARPGADVLAEFCDATHGAASADFTLTVRDCVAGLARASAASMISFTDGSFDPDEYDLLDDPLNGDVHAVVPGRLIAFKGPRADAVSAAGPWADRGGVRDFHPTFYADLFRRMGVRLVVRLSEPCYDAAECARAGVPVLDLRFDSHAAPPLAVVFRFFRAIDEAAGGGVVAVHCSEGRGRTATLVALWLMRTHRFTAREAIAWLRVVRQGSVIGPQQQYLEGMQAKMWLWGALSPLKQAELIRRGCEVTAPAPA